MSVTVKLPGLFVDDDVLREIAREPGQDPALARAMLAVAESPCVRCGRGHVHTATLTTSGAVALLRWADAEAATWGGSAVDPESRWRARAARTASERLRRALAAS